MFRYRFWSWYCCYILAAQPCLPPLLLKIHTSVVSRATVYKRWFCNLIVRLCSFCCTCSYSVAETIQFHGTVPIQKLRTIHIVMKIFAFYTDRKFISVFRNPLLGFYPEPPETTPPPYTYFL